MKQLCALVLGAVMSSSLSAQELQTRTPINNLDLSNAVSMQFEQGSETRYSQDACNYNFLCPKNELTTNQRAYPLDIFFSENNTFIQTRTSDNQQVHIKAQWDVGDNYFLEVNREQVTSDPWSYKDDTPVTRDLYKKNWMIHFTVRF